MRQIIQMIKSISCKAGFIIILAVLIFGVLLFLQGCGGGGGGSSSGSGSQNLTGTLFAELPFSDSEAAFSFRLRGSLGSVSHLRKPREIPPGLSYYTIKVCEPGTSNPVVAPLKVTKPFSGDTALATVELVPVGWKTVWIGAYDARSLLLGEGSVDVLVSPGDNPAVVVGMTPAHTLISIGIDPTPVEIGPGEIWKYTATGLYADGAVEDITDEAAWTCDNSNAGSIAGGGVFTASASGPFPQTARITASLGGITGNSAEITVSETAPTLQSIMISPDSADLASGGSQQFIATGQYSDGTSQDITDMVTWSCDNANAGSISSTGSFTAASGEAFPQAADIKASSQGVTSNTSIVRVRSEEIIMGGSFTTVEERYRIARADTTGSLDTSFNSGAGTDDSVRAIAVQTDKKILIGGWFTTYNGISRNYIARLNADGSLDTSFDPGSGADNYIYCLTLQPDGKILIGGDFASYNGTGRSRIARLNADGTLDTSFDPGTGANGSVLSLKLQTDGKIIAGGAFTSYNGTGRNRIARLDADGVLDTSFNPGTGTNGSVQSTVIQPDGKIVAVGWFSTYNSTGRNFIARINSDGSLDTSFNPGTGANNYLRAAALQADGRILIGGWFTSYNGTGRNYLARINSDGSLDNSFNPGSGPDSYVLSIAFQPDGKILAGGWFGSYNGTQRVKVARINTDGSLDTSFDPGTGADSFVGSIALQSDGMILFGGNFVKFNSPSRNRIAGLKKDGTADSSFDPGTGADGTVLTAVVQYGGRITIGGSFASYDGVSRSRIARLNADGSLDTSFDPGTGADSDVTVLALQNDGKVIIGGSFTVYNGTSRNRIARLNADGSLDTSFDPGAGPGADILALALQPDGRIIIGGSFTSYNGTSRSYIARLNADGSLDTSFDPGDGFDADVQTLTIQPDGRIIAGGFFTSFNGTARNYIARLNAYGSLDTSFAPGPGADDGVLTSAIQSDGKILIGGGFTNYYGTPRSKIARVNADGSLDTSFDPGTGADSDILVLALQSDGEIIAGGTFTNFNGISRNYMARLNSNGSLDSSFNNPVPDGFVRCLLTR